MADLSALRKLLDKKVEQFNQPGFIQDDPISIPHQFSRLQDIEISGFIASIFAWGIRKTIIQKSNLLLQRMDNAPYEFCLHHRESDLKRLIPFVHRTFNSDDLLYFISFFKYHYSHHNSLEAAFFNKKTLRQQNVMEASLNHFYDYFFSLPYVPDRTRKHIAAPKKNSSCKRLNMFMRWMVRHDRNGVDFGLWKKINPSQLICPLDVHVARAARALHLLTEKQNNWRAAVELTENLRTLDPKDPVKYDFALFGSGILKK